jgi:hypothetical protein
MNNTVLILGWAHSRSLGRSGVHAASRRMGYLGASWFETAQVRLLTMKVLYFPVNTAFRFSIKACTASR